MNNSLVIDLQQVGVSYRRYAKPRDALWEWLSRKPRHELFHALQAIDVQLQAGDSLGIVGDNGAGKSTLLKLLAGNLPPSQGYCSVQGHKGALLELGTGLQPELSGEDNIRLGLAMRGLNQQQIKQVLPEVLAFAELNAFACQAVKTYSSGMVVRLAFAIAVAIEPQVLIVDEALAVGDQYFQKKSLDRMRAILQGGATLVFCSHNLYQIRELCQQTLWLEKGRAKMLGPTQIVVDAYQNAVRAQQAKLLTDSAAHNTVLPGNHPQLLDVQLNQTTLRTHETLVIRVAVSLGNKTLVDVHVGIVIRRNDDIQCYGISTVHDQVQLQPLPANHAETKLVIKPLPLLSGDYCLEVWLIDASGLHVYDSRERCCYFHVQQDSQAQGIGMVWLAHTWQTASETVKDTHALVA